MTAPKNSNRGYCPGCGQDSRYWLGYVCPKCGTHNDVLYSREHVATRHGKRLSAEQISREYKEAGDAPFAAMATWRKDG